MKIAVIGKGGVGKTTTTGTIARLMAQRGLKVITLDCDANPNLGLSLGLSIEETERLAAVRQALDEEETEHAPTIPEVIERFGSLAPDQVRLVVVSKIDHLNPG
jgi:CO dehydrogenase maturation factor